MRKANYVLSLITFCALGCNNNNTTALPPDMTVIPPPPPPALGDQIDRMGRPAVNTALTDPFDINPTMNIDMIKDAYNSDKDRSMWVAHWAAAIKVSLGIYDGLDTMCGNQAAADLMPPRYSALAGLLADDVLLLDTSQTS